MGAGQASGRTAGRAGRAWGLRGACGQLGARARGAVGARACGAGGSRQALGVGVGARGARPGHSAWACLCAWWACWLGQLGQFGFW